MVIRNLFTAVVLSAVASVLGLAQAAAPGAGKQIKKDEVYFSLARKINAVTESTVSALVAELDGVVEVSAIAVGTDGKAMVTVKERAPSSAAYTNKSTRLIFAPPATGEQWTWEQFEENRKFYPVDKLFPYVKDELNKRRLMTNAKWSAFITAVNKQAEAGAKALETAKAVLKADAPPAAALAAARAAMTEAAKENKLEETINAYREIQQQAEPILALGDSYSDLKANDAYLRLIEEFKNAVNVTKAARKDYAQSVAAYNESLIRLPFALAAYGLQFTKIEANLGDE
ncbi:MAG: LemA family protein [Blastocatellia bacterium]|nr:LemA family protein [Blastocatellia bacterium]